jgi:hypothetical protein
MIAIDEKIQVTDTEKKSLLTMAEEIGWYSAIAHCRQHCRTEIAFAVQLHVWFDGFRTLKFIHYLRDQLWPSLPCREIFAQGRGLPNDFEGRVLADFKQRLCDFSD